MAKKISELEAATTISDSDMIAVVQGGKTKKLSKIITVLKEVLGINTLNGNFAGAMVADINDLYDRVRNSPYAILFNGSATGAPKSQYGVVFGSYINSDKNGIQIALVLNSTNAYVRCKSGGTWGDWRVI